MKQAKTNRVPTDETVEVKTSNINNRGCYARRDLPRGRMFATYGGEVVRGKNRIQKRLRAQEKQGVIKVISLSEETAIDGAVDGNASCYINHSCDPNSFMRVVGSERVGFFARRDIRAGDEITIDYRDPQHPKPSECRCGASNCRSRRSREKHHTRQADSQNR